MFSALSSSEEHGGISRRAKGSERSARRKVKGKGERESLRNFRNFIYEWPPTYGRIPVQPYASGFCVCGVHVYVYMYNRGGKKSHWMCERVSMFSTFPEIYARTRFYPFSVISPRARLLIHFHSAERAGLYPRCLPLARVIRRVSVYIHIDIYMHTEAPARRDITSRVNPNNV